MAFTNPKGRTQSSLSEINVTPLVDVVLVLLIIFMVTAPVIESGLDITVPQTRAVREITQERVTVSIDSQQRLYVGTEPVNIHQLASKLHAMLRDPDPARQVVFLRADKTVPFQMVASVLDELWIGGIYNVSVVTKPLEKSPGAK